MAALDSKLIDHIKFFLFKFIIPNLEGVHYVEFSCYCKCKDISCAYIRHERKSASTLMFAFLFFSIFFCFARMVFLENGSSDISWKSINKIYHISFTCDSNDIKNISKSSPVIEKNRFKFFDFYFKTFSNFWCILLSRFRIICFFLI